jgi:prepilin-type N-terminal cleavage/methylation domain-containing protein
MKRKRSNPRTLPRLSKGWRVHRLWEGSGRDDMGGSIPKLWSVDLVHGRRKLAKISSGWGRSPRAACLAALSNYRGFTLTEIAIVLGVIGLVLGAIWVAVGSVQEGQKINQALQELQTVSQGVISLQNGRAFTAAPDTDITSAMIAANAIPSWAVISPTAAGNPWLSEAGGLIVYSGGNLNVFRVSFAEIPNDACIALATQATSCQYGQSGCPMEIVYAANGADVYVPPGATWQGFNPTIAQNNICAHNAAPAPGAANSIEFDYSLQ